MKTFFNKITAVVTASVLFAACIVFDLPVKMTAAAVTESGDCGANGSNVTWQLDDAGVLTISGTGAMQDYELNIDSSYQTTATSPWYEHADDVKEVVVGNGVTHIGNCSFCDLGLDSWSTECVKVTLPDSVTSIGDYAFKSSRLESIPMPSKLETIGDGSFCMTEVENSDPVIFPKTVKSIGEMGFVAMGPESVSYYDGVIIEKCKPIDYETYSVDNLGQFMTDYGQSSDFAMKVIYLMLYFAESRQFTADDDTFTVFTNLCNGTVNVLTAEADHSHKVCENVEGCPSCAHSDTTWTPWSDTTKLPNTTGNYYLTDNVTVSAATTITSGQEVFLCLNGCTVTMSDKDKSIYNVSGTLNLSDCQTNGKLTALSLRMTVVR